MIRNPTLEEMTDYYYHQYNDGDSSISLFNTNFYCMYFVQTRIMNTTRWGYMTETVLYRPFDDTYWAIVREHAHEMANIDQSYNDIYQVQPMEINTIEYVRF